MKDSTEKHVNDASILVKINNKNLCSQLLCKKCVFVVGIKPRLHGRFLLRFYTRFLLLSDEKEYISNH